MDIIIRNVVKKYRGGVHALRGLSVDIPTGMFGLLGANGAGKTTLMRIIAGILRPSSGGVTVGEWDLKRDADRRAVKSVLGYLPQDLGLYPDLTARGFLDYVAILKGLDDAGARRRRVEELLETTGLHEMADRRLKTYSGGMRRRVGIAQALLNDPMVLVVDEPTAGLDPEERVRFRNMLAHLGGERTVLLSTHIVEDVAQTCRNLAVLNAGLLLFAGTTDDLVARAAGCVWLATTDGEPPDDDVTIAATMNLGHAVQYRVVGERPRTGEVVPAAPNLEDGYLALVRESRRAADACDVSGSQCRVLTG
jgi:ABC-type multidrug transport system ATPase subunit